jgi:A/G-specific adenine glycosylase
MHTAGLTETAKRVFRRKLLSWYDQHKRDLPWRATENPYLVWLSEIMLQQTRVNAVRDHYHDFVRKFSTIERLAAARSTSVLAAWSGLGYYRRARMMHRAARLIVKEHGGKIPACAAELQNLPGIGRYTAAAIASIAFREPVAVVDGNVARVLQRLEGRELAAESCWSEATALLSRARPGDFNQAMMELGATVCLPRQPKCLVCPVFEFCAARGELARPARPQRRQAQLHYSLTVRDTSVQLVRRPRSASLMPGMWELPEVQPNGHEVWLTLKHSITVTDYTVHVSRNACASLNKGQWIPASRLPKVPLTGLARKILRAAEII